MHGKVEMQQSEGMANTHNNIRVLSRTLELQPVGLALSRAL
jgi:hypothetical protein